MKIPIIIAISIIFGIGVGFSLNASAEEELIPPWIKSTAGFWVEGQIGDAEFISALQFLVKEKILVIPEDDESYETTTVPETTAPKNDVDSSSFPDPSKDPRYYLERYYTESSYKSWYDKNFPDIRIEDKIGYDKIIVPDNAYVNEFFEFSIVPPTNWITEETPETVDNVAGIVSFVVEDYKGEQCDYTPQFIIHYVGVDEPYAYTPEGLLDTYEFVIYFEESSQTKLVEREHNEIYHKGHESDIINGGDMM